MEDKTIEQLDTDYKALTSRREQLVQNKVRVEAELAARKRSLKEAMDECKKAGFDPNNLQEEIRKAKEVLSIKMDNFRAELEASEEIIKPMLREIG